MKSKGVALAAGALFAAMLLPVAPFAAERVAATPCADPALPHAILDGVAAAAGSKQLRTIRVVAPNATLTLAVADTDERREKGLMCVTALRADAGMIFVFAKAAEYPFWMKDTLVPLDMLWLDAQGRVTTLAAHVPASTLDTPDDKVAQRSGRGKFVIELRAGEAARAGIGAGDRLQLPELGAS